MKTSITSNWRPLLRAFYPFVIAIAVLWAMPKNALAQRLFVSSGRPLEPGFVSEYDASSGKVIHAHFIRGLNFPTGLVVFGNTLFVANSGSGTVGKYDANTGGAINAGFIAGLKHPFGLAVSAAGKLLWVSERGNGTVSLYFADAGAPVHSTGPVIISGLNDPSGLAISGKTLFVANTGSEKVGKYDALSGKEINASFITHLNNPIALAVFGNKLLVAYDNNDKVGVWDAATGAAINASLITGLNRPDGLAVLGDILFVANYNFGTSTVGKVGKYEAATGKAIDLDFITGLTDGALGIAVSAK